jgi:hypothetical protein
METQSASGVGLEGKGSAVFKPALVWMLIAVAILISGILIGVYFKSSRVASLTCDTKVGAVTASIDIQNGGAYLVVVFHDRPSHYQSILIDDYRSGTVASCQALPNGDGVFATYGNASREWRVGTEN